MKQTVGTVWNRMLPLLMAVMLLAGCSSQQTGMVASGETEQREPLVFFSPIAKGNEHVQSNQLPAFEQSMEAFEAANPGIQLQYKTFTQSDYLDKSYDEVVLERVHGHIGDDVYIMNPDVAYSLSQEGYLYDLSGLTSVQALTDAARNQCTIGGKVVSMPMQMISYCLFVNEDLLRQYGLSLPNTKQEFLHCCQVLKQHGVMPLAGNRWWLENFVLTQGFASLYFGPNMEEKIAALNSGKTPISQYMRPGIEFLAELMEQKYFDAEFAATAEAGDERDLFLNGEAAFVIHNDGAINDAVYGSHSFSMAVIGFPTDEYGQVSLMNASNRLCIDRETDHLDAAIRLVESMCSAESVQAMSEENGGFPSRKDVEVGRAEALSQVYANVDAGRVIPGSNPEIALEQWGTTCQMIQDLLAGASVEDVLAEFDRLQLEAMP